MGGRPAARQLRGGDLLNSRSGKVSQGALLQTWSTGPVRGASLSRQLEVLPGPTSSRSPNGGSYMQNQDVICGAQ